MSVTSKPSDVIAEFTREVEAWMDENASRDIEYIRDAQKMSYEQFKLHRDLMRALGAKGWLWPTAQAKYGGGGLTPAHQAVLTKAMGDRGMALVPLMDFSVLAIPAILACGTEEQKQRLLPDMYTGNGLTWQLFTEPEAGTDVSNQQTNALRYTKEGEYFIINGQKIFVGAIHPPPDYFFMLTRSDVNGARHQNLSAFLCPGDLPGITIQPLDLFTLSPFMAICGPSGANVDAIKNSVFFDNVKVHESRLIGEEGKGWAVVQAALMMEHGGGGGEAKPAPIEISTTPAPTEARKTAPANIHDEVPLRGRWMDTPLVNFLGERFLDECRDNPMVVKRLKDNPKVLDNFIDSYIFFQTERALSLRNNNGMGGAYGGPQLMLYQKRGGAKFGADMASIFGPVAFTDDPDLTLHHGIFEVGERCSICQAPSGTPEAMKIVISRALSIGR